MESLRRHICKRPVLACWLVAMALLMKIMVPAGMMPTTMADGTITVSLCTDMGVQTVQMQIPGLAHDKATGDQQIADQSCAFAGLGMPSLSGAGPILLAIALAFIIAAGWRAVARPLAAPRAYLRPHPTGPPAA